MIFHDIEQNTEEWYDIRRGVVTSSNFGTIMANYGKAFGEPAKKYAYKIAYEGITGEDLEEERYSNIHMENGHTYEPIAKEAYEYATFNDVSNGGFCMYDEFYKIGGSPDGLILDSKGGIEIKSVIPYTQSKTLKRERFDPSYKWQILGNIWICGLDWMDFISYGFRNTEDNKLFIDRVKASEFEDDIKKLSGRVFDFLDEVEKQKRYV
ncbi:exonuclease [Cellulophaga phage phi10:1]|uniref:Exonuclease, YqaJ (Recombinase) n=1 Tax=Cellulophaga phage phi10:1 TaxID=1327981 RepID=S0A2A9_9CAUD|nr:exonuclease [Cellulophaga phage phi10:1]AGO48358.1 exonuclease, YqaJ (recombinase) [Cellulophaga phage phi10:1]